jgi:hypothetical protein
VNATEDGEPLGESPAIDTLTAIGRGAVAGILGAADEVLATKQLAERQTRALNEIRKLAEFWCDGLPGQPFARRAGKRILRAIDSAGA